MYRQKDKGTKWSTDRRTEEQMEQNVDMYVCTDRKEWLFETVVDVKRDTEREIKWTKKDKESNR
jgi:hypothetical protein